MLTFSATGGLEAESRPAPTDRPLHSARVLGEFGNRVKFSLDFADEGRAAGDNPFIEYQVPETVIKRKQGFARLVRSKTDRGLVVVLDPRVKADRSGVKTKRYGSIFLESLAEFGGEPSMRMRRRG